MKVIAQWLSNLVIAFSIGTVISLAVVLGMLWWKGALADERVLGMLAALQEIKPAPPQQKAKAIDAHPEQPSLDEIMQAVEDYQAGRLGIIPADQMAPRNFA